jgi:hypothetical protein
MASEDSWIFLPFVFPAELNQLVAGPEEAENLAGENPPPDSDPFSDAESGENLGCSSSQFVASANRRSEFHKRSQLLIGVHNETHLHKAISKNHGVPCHVFEPSTNSTIVGYAYNFGDVNQNPSEFCPHSETVGLTVKGT